MSSAAPPLLKPLSRAHCCLTSLPTLFTTKASHPFLSIHPKPTNLTHLSCFSSSTPLPSRLSLKPKVPSSSFTTLVAQTSDWAQQEEAQEDTIDDTQAPVSEWNPEGEESSEGDEEGSYQEPPEEAKLFVGNLHFDIDSEKLAQLFDQAGVVEVAEVIYNRETDRSRGFGFVTMSTVEEAEKAVEMFHRYDVNGRLLTVNKAAPKGTQAERPPRVFEASFRIYVGNLPWEVDNASLEQVFSEHGKVVDARVVFDRETGRSRGFGFVTMSSQTEVDDAVAALDGQSLGGRPIRVNIAEERPRRSFF